MEVGWLYLRMLVPAVSRHSKKEKDNNNKKTDNLQNDRWWGARKRCITCVFCNSIFNCCREHSHKDSIHRNNCWEQLPPPSSWSQYNTSCYENPTPPPCWHSLPGNRWRFTDFFDFLFHVALCPQKPHTAYYGRGTGGREGGFVLTAVRSKVTKQLARNSWSKGLYNFLKAQLHLPAVDLSRALLRVQLHHPPLDLAWIRKWLSNSLWESSK